MMSVEDLQHQVAGSWKSLASPALSAWSSSACYEMDRTLASMKDDSRLCYIRAVEAGVPPSGKTWRSIQRHYEGKPQELQHRCDVLGNNCPGQSSLEVPVYSRHKGLWSQQSSYNSGNKESKRQSCTPILWVLSHTASACGRSCTRRGLFFILKWEASQADDLFVRSFVASTVDSTIPLHFVHFILLGPKV